MTFPKLFLTSAFVVLTLISSTVVASEIKNKHLSPDATSSEAALNPSHYQENVTPVHDTKTVTSDDPHVRILDWHSVVPLGRILGSIQEGTTDQLSILKLFSAPNVITRDPKLDKETWVYHWAWSYKNEQDLNQTLILMDKPGTRLKRYQKPVSMQIVFTGKDIVESYEIKFLKNKNDYFDAN